MSCTPQCPTIRDNETSLIEKIVKNTYGIWSEVTGGGSGGGGGSSGALVTVSSPAFNPSASFTRPNDTTAYDANDVVGTDPGAVLEFANAGGLGKDILITAAHLRIDVGSVPSGMSIFRLHLFNEAPTAIADKAAFNLPAADRTKYLGYIDLKTPDDIGDTLWSENVVTPYAKMLRLDTTTLYGVLQTLAAYTPSAETNYDLSLNTVQVN